MSNFTINERGFWESVDGSGHLHDHSLSNAMIQLLKQSSTYSILDLGCGMGDYTKNFMNSGFKCDAFDGNPNTEQLTGGIGKVLDLSVPFKLSQKYDCVLSLEVGEHIPKEFEQTFIDNVCEHSSKLLILSWAVVGQGGDGHVNCQNNDYIINEVSKRNFTINAAKSNFLRQSSILPWFGNTILVFDKNI